MPPKGSQLSSAEKKRRADARTAALAKGDEYLEIITQEHKEEMELLQETMRKMQVELARATGAAATSGAGAAPGAHRGKVDVPAFWEEDVDMWFMQVEAGFRRQNVGRERWYDCIMTELPRAVVTSSRSVIQDCGFGENNGYQLLKRHILKQFGKTPWQKGFALLHSPHLGDRRPSQLLQDLRALKPDGDFGKTIFECMFLERLPASMSDPILSSGTSDVDDMAEIADRLFDKPAPPSVAVVDSLQRKGNRPPGRSPDRAGRSPVRKSGRDSGKGGFSGNFRSGGRPPTPGPAKKSTLDFTILSNRGLCALHERFGRDARRCVHVQCSFAEN
jgi:hypothetical protein